MADALRNVAFLVAFAGLIIGFISWSHAADFPIARYVGLGAIIDCLIYALVLFALGHIVDRVDSLYERKTGTPPLPASKARPAPKTGDSYLDGDKE